MYKSYKFRLYPNKTQLEEINKIFKGIRYVYNYYLKTIIETNYKGPKQNLLDYEQKLKHTNPLLQTVDKEIIIKTLFNLDDNIKKSIAENTKYPKYKSKNDKISYTIKTNNEQNIKLDLFNQQITLPKLNVLKIRGYRNLSKIEGKIMRLTISKELNGKYYISLLYKIVEIKQNINPKSIVGLDLGITTLHTLSDGTTYENNKYILKYEKRINRLQKELSRKVPYSNNYYKCKEKVRKAYSKLKNARKFYIHQITKEITDNYDIIICEKLNTKELTMKKQNAKNILDASFYEIITQLQYKCKFKQKHFYQIDTYYPSSQKCSLCSNIDKTYKNLSERTYKCKHCHNELDRDLNASINIMFEGLKLHMKTINN